MAGWMQKHARLLLNIPSAHPYRSPSPCFAGPARCESTVRTAPPAPDENRERSIRRTLALACGIQFPNRLQRLHGAVPPVVDQVGHKLGLRRVYHVVERIHQFAPLVHVHALKPGMNGLGR